MDCPNCSGKSKVSNSRPSRGGVWRRRICKQCQTIWSTHEQINLSSIIKPKETASEASEPVLHRDELLIIIYDSVQHRKTSAQDASALTDTIIQKLITKYQSCSQKELEQIIYDTLLRFDEIAAGVFSAKYHKEL